MRRNTRKVSKKASEAEVMESISRSLAFQVTMIMWEDRQRQGVINRKRGLSGSYRLS